MKRPQQRQRAGKEHPRGPVGPLRAADDRAAEGVHILPFLVVYGKECGIELHGLNGGRRDKEHRAEEEAEQRPLQRAVARHRHKEARGGKRERDTAARAKARKARREQVLFLLLALWRGLCALLLPRRGAFAAQQLVAGHAEYLRNDRNKRKIRRTVVAFPARNGFVRHVQPLRQLLLRHAVRAAQGREEAAHCFLFHKSDLLLVFGWLDSTAASERMPPNGAGLSLAVREFYSSPANFGSSQPTSSGPRPTVMRAVGATM